MPREGWEAVTCDTLAATSIIVILVERRESQTLLVRQPRKSPGRILLLFTDAHFLIRLDVGYHRVLPQKLNSPLGECPRVPLERVRDVVRMLDGTKEFCQGVMPAEGMLASAAEVTGRFGYQGGSKEGVMLSDGRVIGMRVEDDDVLVIEGLCVAGDVDGGLVGRVSVESAGPGDEEG